MPGSTEPGIGALPAWKRHRSTASLKVTTWLSLLAHVPFGLEIRGECYVLVPKAFFLASVKTGSAEVGCSAKQKLQNQDTS